MLGALTRVARRPLVAMALAGLVSTAASAQTTLTFGGSDAVGSLLDRANARFAELVNERAAGALKVNFIQGEQLGNDIQVIEQMMQGSVHLYGDVLGWYANWVKDFAILNWGFTFDDNDHVQRFLDGDVYNGLVEKLRASQGIRILAAAPTQPRVLFAKRAVNSPADLADMKMRVPEIKTYLLLWQTLGTKPSRVAWAEVFLGLKTGTIEAAEGPVSAAYAQKFHQAAQFVMRTDHLVSTYHITMNDKTFSGLTPDQQKLLTDTAREVVLWARAQAEGETEGLVQKMASEGATIVKVDPKPFADKALAGVEKMEADGEWSAGLWNQIRALK
ncbi:MAG: TRAP transporter substrate-binding protein [Ectothiorhodospiraceae bacterium]|nr:TRAP transporter substrate-binding protein [Ectothiorhodospiraceae bacterium]